MYVTRVPNRGSPPAILLRESYRAGGKVRTRTLANLSALSDTQIDAIRAVLRGETLVGPLAARFEAFTRKHQAIAAEARRRSARQKGAAGAAHSGEAEAAPSKK